MDPKDKRTALRAINYGLYVLTAADGDAFGAAGINWLSQASFEPPLVMAAVKADSETCAIVRRTGSFAVNVLGEDHLDVGKSFFRPTTVEDDRINGNRFFRAPHSQAPVLLDLPYWFEGQVTDTIDRGDHTIFVAEVVGAGVHDESVVPLVLRSTGMNYGG